MVEKKAVVEYRSQGGVDIQLTPEVVRNFLVQGKKELVSAQELMYFMNVCRARRLNPFIKDCYLIKYGSDPAAIVTSVDYFRKNARKAPDCKGWKAGIVILREGEITYREGSLILDEETLVGGWAEAQPDGWNEPKRHTINLKGYIKKTRDGKITRFWEPDKQPDMIAKVAESQLLRQLWGEETTGMYAAEEMPSIEDAKGMEPVQSDIKQRIKDGKKQADKPKDKPGILDLPGVESGTIDVPQLKNGYVKIDEFEKRFHVFCESVGMKRPDVNDYLVHLREYTGAEITNIMQMIMGDPKTEFRKMNEWLSEMRKPAETKESEQETTNGSKKRFAMKDLPFNNPVWNPEKWIKTKSSGFSTHVWKHVATLHAEPEALQKAVKKKWKKLFRNDPFPTVEAKDAQTISGSGNGVDHIEAEVYHDPRQNGKPALLPEDDDFQQPAPDKDDLDGTIKWLRMNFSDELAGAMDYLGFAGRQTSLMSDDEKQRVIKATNQLIDSE